MRKYKALVLPLLPMAERTEKESSERRPGKAMEEKLIEAAWEEIARIQVFVMAYFRSHIHVWHTSAEDLAQTWAIEMYKGFSSAFKGSTEEEVRRFINTRAQYRQIDALRMETVYRRFKRGNRIPMAMGEDEEKDIFMSVKARTPAPDEQAIIRDELRKAYGNIPNTLLTHVLFAQGWTMKEIGAFFGKCESTAWKYFHGIDCLKKERKKHESKKWKTQEIIEAWKQGLSLQEIGMKFGRHPESVRDTLQKHHIIQGKKDTYKRSETGKERERRFRVIYEMWTSGIGILDISRNTSYSYSSVRDILKSHGVPVVIRSYKRKARREHEEICSLEATAQMRAAPNDG